MVSVNKNSYFMHENFTIFMVPAACPPLDTSEEFLHLEGALCGEGQYQNSDIITFCELDKISKDRKNKAFPAPAGLRTSS